MNDLQKNFSFYSALFTMRTLFAAGLITIFCFGGSITNRAQSAPAEQSIGAIDPLLENFKSPPRRNYDFYKNISADEVSQKQIDANAPTDGELDPSLNVLIDSLPGNVRATVLQPDGKILVGGYFRTVNDVRQKSIARLNADFTLDTTFSAEVNGTILAIAVQTDGKIVIGGAFTSVGGASRNRIARLNADGSLDTSFNPGAGADALVYDVAIQTDGKILVGGNFFQINSTNNYAVARLNADGSVDASFASPIPPPIPTPNPPFPIPGIVYSIALQTDGKIVIGGFIIKTYNPVLMTTPIARLNQNGSFDSSFNPGTINSNALKVAVQPDGKILLAGFFNRINGVSTNFIARLNADGSLDASFKIGTGANAPVLTIFLQSDGKILLGGLFSSFNGTSRNRIARLNADGTLDMTFNPGSSSFVIGTIQSITALSGGKVLVGGALNGGAFSSDSIRVFNADGSTDSSVRFRTTALGGVRAIAVQADGKIIVGGNFNRPGGNSLSQVFRLNPDGSLDTTFGGSSTNFSITSNGQINSILVQPDGKIIIAGYNFGYSPVNNLGVIANIARFNADGTADESFTAGNIPTARGINAAALQSDGKVVVVWGYNLPNGFPTGGIARLNGDGSLDSTFNNTLPATFFDSVVIQPDGKILVGGPFSFGFVNSQTGNVAYNGVVRLNADGSRDTTFVPATIFEIGRITEVSALALQTDGKILIGGRIYTSSITTAAGIARLDQNGALDTTFSLSAISGVGDIARVEDIFPLPNGKILIGGFFDRIGSRTQNNIARLNADGSLDNSFGTTTDNTVHKITIQADGKVLIGGDFETVNGVIRTSLARLLSEPSAQRTKFDFDGDGKADISVFRPDNGVWYLLNSQNGLTAAQFGVAADKLVPADYDGDGKTDLAVYRGGTWYLNRSSAGFIGFAFGAPDDIPQPADFDGDGKAELAVWRPSNGTWYVYNLATNQFNAAQFGASTDKPVVGDYDGDNKADYAVFRPSNGTWYLQRSSSGFTGIQFGDAADNPVPADYDGDNKTDITVFRPSNGTWYRLNSSNGQFVGMQFGVATDLPTPADYDGDGKTDIAVFRNSIWYIQQSTNGFTGIQFGANSDKPVPNVYIP